MKTVSVATIVLLALLVMAGAQAADRPNFIFFITDDISPDELGCYGGKLVKTPNIDRLAADGVQFTNAYVATSSCSPSRCSYITGRYPHNHGAAYLHTELPADQFMFPQRLREAGYYTALSGKNHMGEAVSAAFELISTGKGPGKEEDWIQIMRERPKDKPFFFWFASTDAHRPWNIDENAPNYEPDTVEPPPFLYNGPLTRKDFTGFYHEVSRTDFYLGELRKELERQSVARNTIVIYAADNGRPFPPQQDAHVQQRRANAVHRGRPQHTEGRRQRFPGQRHRPRANGAGVGRLRPTRARARRKFRPCLA